MKMGIDSALESISAQVSNFAPKLVAFRPSE